MAELTDAPDTATSTCCAPDMTDEMLALARENQRKAGIENVEITETQRVHDCAGSAIIRARKPS